VAKTNYLVEGLSGTGKSSVYDELTRRGYSAISTDRAWSYLADPVSGLAGGPSRHDNWKWDKTKALEALEADEPDVLFVCGSSRNRDEFLHYFSKIFNLKIDDETMIRRLTDRTNNDFGKRPEEVQLMLALNRKGEKPAGAIDIDASKPLKEVVDEILDHCMLDPSSDS
jgi:gluconate kinase